MGRWGVAVCEMGGFWFVAQTAVQGWKGAVKIRMDVHG